MMMLMKCSRPRWTLLAFPVSSIFVSSRISGTVWCAPGCAALPKDVFERTAESGFYPTERANSNRKTAEKHDATT